MTKLMGYQYKIIYKKGVSNRVADALSRAHHSETFLSAISVAQPLWLHMLQESYADSPETQTLLSALAIQPSYGHYTLTQGIIKYKQAI
jgi:hypothetical protein